MSKMVALRTSSGRFAEGQSGNPAGRPKGSRNRTTLLADALAEGQQEALIEKLVADALAGDRVLLRFCVERLLAKPGDRTVALELQPGAEKDPEAILAATMRALADGEITPAEAVRIARAATAISRAKLDHMQERCAEAGARLRNRTRPAREAGSRPAPVPPARISAAARPVDRQFPGQTASPPSEAERDAAPVNHLYPGRARLPAAAGDRIPPRLSLAPAPAFGLFSRTPRRARLLASVSASALAAPEMHLFSSVESDAETPRLAA